MNIGLALLLIVIFLASAASLLGGAVVYYGTTEGVANGINTSAVGSVLMLFGIAGFVLFAALLGAWALRRRRG